MRAISKIKFSEASANKGCLLGKLPIYRLHLILESNVEIAKKLYHRVFNKMLFKSCFEINVVSKLVNMFKSFLH